METTTEQNLKAQVLEHGSPPQHIAIIMDGNGRWAKSRGLPRVAGHKEGVLSVREITQACSELGVKVLTLFTFSSENWRRPRREVDALMRLLVTTIREEVQELLDNAVQLTAIGCLDDLPQLAREELQTAISMTSANNGLKLNLALSYGGRQDILQAVQHLASAAAAGSLDPATIDETLFSRHLYTAGMTDPDLIIRTSGEARLSNFLIWQSAFAELVITDAMWPAFRRRELYEAILVYQQRERRYGQISEQVQHSQVAG